MRNTLLMRNGLVIDPNGNKIYYKDNLYHREGNLPAYEYPDGGRFYYENGKLHRLNGLPAEEYSNGSKSYYEYGELHRLDGPAIDFLDAPSRWYIKGKRLSCTTQEEFEQLMKLKAFW